MSKPDYDAELDARGLLCPMPVIRTQNMLKQLEIGKTLRIVATDPGVLHDIPAWCRVNGHAVLSSDTHANGDIVIIVQSQQSHQN